MTLPGRPRPRAGCTSSTQTLREIYRIFGEMGFQVYRARAKWRPTSTTSSCSTSRPTTRPGICGTPSTPPRPGVLLRTHTSPGQIHVMREFAPEPDPRGILPGMCYRYEQISARTEIQFNQVEGLAVGRQHHLRRSERHAERFRPAHVRRRACAPASAPRYFPFTEPSAEMDVECFVCGGEGCGVCKGSGWLEILGCGMVHPIVLRNGGYDPQQFIRLRLRHGPRAHHHAAPPHRGHPLLLGE